MTNAAEVSKGAANLLERCAGLQPGQRLLLIEEPRAETLYCPRVGDALAARAAALGAPTTRVVIAPDAAAPGALPGAVADALADADHAVFLNRVGDDSRFLPLPSACSKTVCYALDPAALASPFATTPYPLLRRLLDRLQSELMRAERWRIVCPLGSDIGGTFCWPSRTGAKDDDFTVTLFPVSTFKPVPCDTASGRVRLSRWLLPGDSGGTGPAPLRFDGVVEATVRDGRIRAVDGPAAAAVERHYAGAAGAGRDRVHSWHAGVNPHAAFAGPVDARLRRWCAMSFASPRYLHFHTCGDTPPGKIAWSLFNPTVWIDGRICWRRGQFVWLRRADNRALIDGYASAGELLGTSADIGVGR